MTTRTELPQPYIDRLAELVHLTRRGYGGEPWNLPGIKAAISKTQDTGAEPLDICCVALTAAADASMKTPALMAESGQHWTLTKTGRPLRPRCEHGIQADTTPGPTTYSACQQCEPKPDLTLDEIRAIRHKAKRDTAPHREATRRALQGDTP